MKQKFKKIKIKTLILVNKFYCEEHKMNVEIWNGETDNEFFHIEIATDSRFGCVAVGAIDEREMNLQLNKTEIYNSKNFEIGIKQIIDWFKWDLKNVKQLEILDLYE